MKLHSALASLALFGICSTAMAQWQWLDQDGRKVFSDRSPPPDVMDKDILKRPVGQTRAALPGASGAKDGVAAAPADGASAPLLPVAGGVDKELEAKKKQAAEAETQKRKAEEERVAKAHKDNCAQARQAMSNLDSGMRITRTNASGEREVLDDASRAVERARVQNVMASECK